MFIYLPVPDLLISWLKSHKSVFAQSLWFRVSIRLAIFLKWPSEKNTLNLCLFVFCLFLWLVGCGFFLCSHTCWNTQWRSDDVTGVYIPTGSSTPGTDRKAERPVAGFSVGCGFFFVVCVLFFSTACSSHLSGENGRSTPASPQMCSVLLRQGVTSLPLRQDIGPCCLIEFAQKEFKNKKNS